jgi:hypothetical protein
MSKLAHTYGSGGWGVFVFIPWSWAVEGLNNLHRNVFCYLFKFLARSFSHNFSKEVQVPQWYSRVTQGVWSSRRVRVLTLFFPTSKADMWSSWVGKSIAYLGYLYCWAEWWTTKDWNLAKFRSYGGWNIQGKGRRWTHTWKGIWSLYLNSIFCNSFRRVGLLLFSFSSFF